MTWTKKDYEAVAEVLYTTEMDFDERQYLTDAFARLFRYDNPNFTHRLGCAVKKKTGIFRGERRCERRGKKVTNNLVQAYPNFGRNRLGDESFFGILESPLV